MSEVKASYLIENFKKMVAEKWAYVANSASYKEVDCSGAFTYWYKKAGGYMYHGSNTMWRRYSTNKGKIGTIKLVPGMAVYKHRDDGKEPSAYKNDKLGNFFHVGLYIGNGLVVEAKGTKSGVVQSKISEWTHCSTLKNTVYDVEETATVEKKETGFPCNGIVNTLTGSLRMRTSASTSSKVKITMPKGAQVQVLEKVNDAWYKVSYGGQIGYAVSSLIKI